MSRADPNRAIFSYTFFLVYYIDRAHKSSLKHFYTICHALRWPRKRHSSFQFYRESKKGKKRLTWFVQILVCVYLWTSISSGSSKRSCVLYDTHIVRFNGGVVGFFCLLFGRIWCGCKHGCVYTVHYVGNSMKFLVLRTD